MNKIASFMVDHSVIVPGFYLSRQDEVVIGVHANTYDIRLVKPNTPPYINDGAAHTIEHLMATYLRNSFLEDKVLYFGPMGCKTGFYVITHHVSHEDVYYLIRDAFKRVSEWDQDIPGVSFEECGNYLLHNLEEAKVLAKHWLEITPEVFFPGLIEYPKSK